MEGIRLWRRKVPRIAYLLNRHPRSWPIFQTPPLHHSITPLLRYSVTPWIPVLGFLVSVCADRAAAICQP